MDIKEAWKEHPLNAQGVVELVPTEWVWRYRGADVSPEADLMDGTIVSLDGLWENLIAEGMHDPLIMRIGLANRKFRLEAGNHRIQVLHQHGVALVPLTVQVRDECGPNAADVMTDATHNFDFGDDVLVTGAREEYLKPSAVFRSLAKQP